MSDNFSSEYYRSPHWVRSWYGVPARIVATDRGLCNVAFIGIPLPHPCLINLVIRHGLPELIKARLFFLHELGHVETLPLLVLPLILLWRGWKASPSPLILNLLALGSFWELVAEIYVIFRSRREYVAAWRQSRNPAALVFWPSLLLLAILPFLIRSHSRDSRQR